MKKVYFLFALFSLQFAIFGCSNQTEQTEVNDVKAQRLTVVSSGDPSTVLPAFKTYTWSKEYTQVLFGENGKDDDHLQNYIHAELKKYLSIKGYKYTPNANSADLAIGFLFASVDDVADKNIEDKFGLLPGLSRQSVNDPRYEKGSLLLAILNSEEQSVYWRSAVQGFIDLEKTSENESSARMQYILDRMLGGLPKAGR